LHVSDRIVVGVETSGEVASALSAHREHLASETLAREVLDGPAEGATPQTAEIDGTAVSITVSKV
jgi:hypothetical protein